MIKYKFNDFITSSNLEKFLHSFEHKKLKPFYKS